MPKQSARDIRLRYVIGIVAVLLAIGFSLAWLYMQHAEKKNKEIVYLTVPVAISRDGHSISASFAIRVSAADADWAAQNKPELELVMKRSLMAVDPVRVREPGGLSLLQDTVREASNAALQTSRVQEVLVTDFLVSEGDL